jgi:hypothetical protein
MSKQNGVKGANNNQKNQLSVHSVLAENFIPKHLLRINELPITVPPFIADRNNSTSVSVPKGLLVPFVPICYCKDKNDDDDMDGSNRSQAFTNDFPLHHFPIRENVTNDLYYAIQYRMNKFSNHHALSNAPTMTSTNGTTTDNAVKPEQQHQQLSSVDTISKLDLYVHTWEKILEMERADVLLKYERFSQYSKLIRFQSTPNNDSNGSSGNNSNTRSGEEPNNKSVLAKSSDLKAKQYSTSVGLIEIKGIADASPNLIIGDIVLIRPMYAISLPLPNQPMHVPLMNLIWTPPNQVVEIQAKIMDVQRGFGGRTNDSVRISWLDSYESSILLYSIKKMKFQNGGRMEETFNVRFVPSNTTYQRCLTALDWLLESYYHNNNESLQLVAMELLYPTVAPTDLKIVVPSSTTDTSFVHSDELNNKQLSFVRMVLARTQQPSMGHIRGPLVLTGPAGTGKPKKNSKRDNRQKKKLHSNSHLASFFLLNCFYFLLDR